MEKRKTIGNRRFRESKLIVMALGFVVSIAIGSTATVAYFSDTASTEVNVQAGSIELGVGQPEQKEYFLDFGEAWYPGAPSLTREIKVYNSGTLPIRYNLDNFSEYSQIAHAINAKILSDDEVLYDGPLAFLWFYSDMDANSSETLTFVLSYDENSPYYFYMDTVSENSLLFTAEVK